MNSLLEKRIERYREFYERPEPGQLLVQICPYTFDAGYAPGTKHVPLSAWQPLSDPKSMANHAVRQIRHFMSFSEQIDCDYIPNIGFAYGIGPCSAFLTDAEVIPGNDTTWVHPVRHDLDDATPLRFDPGNRWVQAMASFTAACTDVWDGDFYVSTGNHFAPSDMANAVRGNDFFLDLFDGPVSLRRLLTECADGVVNLHRYLLQYTPNSSGGSAAGGMWMPGDALFLSEDASDLVSASLYETQLRPYTQRILDATGGAYVHHHAKGWHIHDAVSHLSRLHCVEISWDPNCPRPIDHLEAFAEASLHVPMQTRCTVRDVYALMDRIKQCRLSLMVNCDTMEEAVSVVRFIRAHSRL